MSRFAFAAAIALIALTPSMPASAAEVHGYSAAAFQAAQAHNKPILIDVRADWCPVCKSQEATISRIVADPRFANLVILRIDFDTQKLAWKHFGANRQATLIGYHGRREVGRVAFQTDETLIAGLLNHTIG